MPEGDTISRAASALRRALAGRLVTAFATAYAHLARVNDDAPLVGRRIEGCESRGKHVLIRFAGDLVLRTHMRMNGSWHLYRPGEPWRRPAREMRVRLDTDAWVAVAFNVPAAELLSGRELTRSPALASLGPDLLSPSFDRGEALTRLAAAGARPIAEALLDQRVVAGIGNVYKSEVLFLCGIHPDRTAVDLTDAERASIVDTAVCLMRAHAGSLAGLERVTYRGLRRTTGRWRAEERLWVYGRSGRPCRRCGTPIASAKRGVDARLTYWCPSCQMAGRRQTLREARRPCAGPPPPSAHLRWASMSSPILGQPAGKRAAPADGVLNQVKCRAKMPTARATRGHRR